MDIYASNWNEDDNSNTTAAPDGAPEGMAPSGVNNVLRAHQGAIKRWYDWSIPKTTAGSGTAYTLAYTVAPGALVDGMSFLVQFHAINGLNPTLNVNSLGAIPLTFYCGGSWSPSANGMPPYMIGADQIVRCVYHQSSGTFRCIDLGPIVRLSLSAASSFDFTGIPSNVNHLEIDFEVRPGTNNVGIQLQTYGADGVLDSGGSDYVSLGTTIKNDNSTGVGTSTSSAANLGGGANSGSSGYGGRLTAQNIQAATWTKFQLHVTYVDQAGLLAVDGTGSAIRLEADRITGVRLSSSLGTVSGRASVRFD